MDERYFTLLDLLECGTLGPAGFGHGDHVGVAVAALRRHGFFKALWVVAEGIRAAADRAGAPEKFNATITLASMCLIAEALHDGDGSSIEAFVATHAEALAPAALIARLGEARLTGPKARRVPLLPIQLLPSGRQPA
jgi:hypothetical protein